MDIGKTESAEIAGESQGWRRVVRLGCFAVTVGLVGYLVVQSGMAWGYAYLLTHPRCGGEASGAGGEEIWLETTDGLKLPARYYAPENGAVIVTMGGSCGALGGALPPVDFLLEAGYGVLQIDSRAHSLPPAVVTLGGNEVLDVEAALAFIDERAEVEKIGALGFSMGGASLIRAAARYPQIEALAAEGGFFNLGDDFIEPDVRKSPFESIFLHSIALAFWMNSGVNPWEISPIDDIGSISPRPILLIYGEWEAGSGRAEAQYQAAGEPKDLWIVPGGAHGRNHLAAPEEYQRRMLEFFNQILSDAP